MDFKDYIKEVDQLYQVGNTTEHSFRGSLAGYLKSLLPKFVVTNEPRRIDCGAPDYVITFKNEPIAFLEAKDINDSDIDGRKEHKEQFTRYKESLNRVIFTDYLDFHLYLEGEFVDSVRIAETRGNRIVGISENEAKFNEMIFNLVEGGRQKITSSSVLARQMAAKAHLLSEAVKNTIQIDGENGEGEVSGQLRAFRDVLIHDLKAEEFADIYAQTIVYGMFTARLNDATPDDFSRHEAAELIPRSNPFLRKIFQSIAVYDLDDSIAWIVDDIAAMFAATDAEKIMRNYGSNKRHSDPIVHFYEDFLAEYDPKLRKARGVWYTPAPVVRFIVKSVDEILQKEFNLARGLADDSTIKVDHVIEQSKDKRTIDGMKHETIDVPRVQVLDPATGTGTFLAEVIQQIRDKFIGLDGLWPSYVEKSLMPRIHGFEILMASYTIAHLKLSYTLKETGYTGQTNQRLNVFLTNSLEEATPRATNLFARWLSDEADAASRVKMNTPVMICLGNPPYSVSSQNNRKWITNLVADYKKDLKERNIQPLSDDYIKFIRLGQYYVEKNGEGILAYISNNSFLDGLIHRQMRKNLLSVFDTIYILNLHGDCKKKEKAPDGRPDENVFDIQQGVSINIFVKTGQKRKDELGRIFYQDLFGDRNSKYDFLLNNKLHEVDWQELNVIAPGYFFVPKDFSLADEYDKYLPLADIFFKNTVCITTGNDDVYVDFSSDELLAKCVSNLEVVPDPNFITEYAYRPFDNRYLYYDQKLIQRARYDIMKSMFQKNICLLVSRQQSSFDFQHIWVTELISNKCTLSSQTREGCFAFPLYIYNDSQALNLKPAIIRQFSDCIHKEVKAEEIMYYIYAVLHSPTYRNKYKSFLKIEFPKIPLPKSEFSFGKLSEYGRELVNFHLLNNSHKWPNAITFPVSGENNVSFYKWDDGNVRINDNQYFGNISETVWNFYIGGYQPAQKWLKDRKGRTLDYQDIIHYGHIIYALQETGRLMREIDEIGVI